MSGCVVLFESCTFLEATMRGGRGAKCGRQYWTVQLRRKQGRKEERKKGSKEGRKEARKQGSKEARKQKEAEGSRRKKARGESCVPLPAQHNTNHNSSLQNLTSLCAGTFFIPIRMRFATSMSSRSFQAKRRSSSVSIANSWKTDCTWLNRLRA